MSLNIKSLETISNPSSLSKISSNLKTRAITNTNTHTELTNSNSGGSNTLETFKNKLKSGENHKKKKSRRLATALRRLNIL